MRAAVALRDVVGEAQHVLVVAVVPPQRRLHHDLVLLLLHHDGLGDEWVLGAVEELDESAQAALIAHLLGLRLDAAMVGEHDAHAGIEEGELAQAMLQRGVIELDHGEGLGATARR